jgi:hypothetical protein
MIVSHTSRHGKAFKEYGFIKVFLIPLGKISVGDKLVKISIKINRNNIQGLKGLCCKEKNNAAPATAMIYVGDSDPVLNNTIESNMAAT